MKKKIFIVLLSILSTVAITLEIDFNIFISLIVCVFCVVFYNKNLFKYKKNNWFIALSILFSIFMLFGNSYKLNGNAVLVFDDWILSVLSLFGYGTLFYVVLLFINDIIINKKIKEKISYNKIILLFKKNPFKFSFILLFICYLPYIIGFFPVIFNPDGIKQIEEVMGYHTWYLDTILLPSNYSTITNFNPVIHTLLLGGFFKIGHFIGSVNFGLFLYTLVQLTIVISVFSYSISYVCKHKMNIKIAFISLIFFALTPVFPFYSLTAVKDIIFSSLILLYTIRLYDYIKYSKNIKDIIILMLISILIILFRNNGIFTIILSFPFLLLLNKNRKWILLSFSFILLFSFSYNKIILPFFRIPNTSIREILSIPFQQTARYVKYYPDEIEEKDKNIIDKILEYETLSERYNPSLADPVKIKYNKYTSNEDLRNYFVVWYKGLLKHPEVYIDATINNSYGYIYPNVSNWYLYTKYSSELKDLGYDYRFNSIYFLRNVLSGVGNYYPEIPILGLTVNIGFNMWVLFALLVLFIVNKKNKLILMLLPCLSILLFCFLGPVNTYFRYVLPIVFSMPILINVLFYELHKHKN